MDSASFITQLTETWHQLRFSGDKVTPCRNITQQNRSFYVQKLDCLYAEVWDIKYILTEDGLNIS
jgi:hypothetical protein